MILRRFSSLLHSVRNRSNIVQFGLQDVAAPGDCVKLTIQKDDTVETLLLPLVWLRDHCSSPKCFHSPTNQRKSNGARLAEEAKLDDAGALSVNDESQLVIRWKDGHVSQFILDDVLQKSLLPKSPDVRKFVNTWDRTLPAIPTISKRDLTQEWFSKALFEYGVAVVNGIQPTSEATEELCRGLVPVHDTFFGQFWVFSNEAKEDEPAHEDTAYGNEEIGPHTDGTYFNQTPGIQVFHCLHPAKVGGQTVVVDGFNCVEILRKQDPAAFQVLTTSKLEHHYLEGSPSGSSLNTISLEKPVIELDSHGNIVQIRFNPYDRAPFRCLQMGADQRSAKKAIRFYDAYQKLARICQDPQNSLQVSLQPGNVIFIDNFRVLHSRTEFQGYRQMCGCYLSRDNFFAKARPFLPEAIRRFV